jgi:hypothetical protein
MGKTDLLRILLTHCTSFYFYALIIYIEVCWVKCEKIFMDVENGLALYKGGGL